MDKQFLQDEWHISQSEADLVSIIISKTMKNPESQRQELSYYYVAY